MPSGIAAAVICAAVAIAAPGDLTYRDCVSGETASAGCTSVPGATATGADSGLAFPLSPVVSPDGRFVYAVSSGDDAVISFRRNLRTGGLTFLGCISGESQSVPPCTPAPNAALNGSGSGLDGAEDLAISADGRTLHVASDSDDAVTTFRRNRNTGALTHRGCLTSDSDVACVQIPGATANGTGTALDRVESIDASADGRSVYTGAGDGTVAHFARNPRNGRLRYRSCISGDSNLACRSIPGATPGGADTGLDSLRYIALSPDGRSLYTASDSDEAIAHFRRRPKSGRLDFRRCITGATEITNCVPIAGATTNGAGTGLRSIVHVTVSPDLNSVYTISDGDDAIARFDRRRGSGALAFRGCFSGDSGIAGCTPIPGATPGAAQSGMEFPVWSEVGPDGRSVHVAGASDDAVATFRRAPRTGAIRPAGCLSAETETTACALIPDAASQGENSGLDNPRSIGASPDGRSLYVTAIGDAAVARFSREPDRRGPRLKLKLKRRQSGTAVLVRATCRDELCARIVARGRIRVGGRSHRLRRALRRNVPAGKRAKLRLRLTASARGALATSAPAQVKVQVVGRDLLGNRTRKRATARIAG